MPNRAVVFVSEAMPRLDSAHLVGLMADARRFNRDAGVTGVTLFDGRRFLAYMEGPPDGLDVAFSRAAGSTSHIELIELARGRVGQRRLPYWPMRLVPVSPGELLMLVRADWTGFLQRGAERTPPATAMEMLVALVEPFAEAA
ncbi:BLUF domain-containing protein [Stenotrophomonas maltophilia]|uniref:BLUF domain-containing protein n=1 Tax=Stenotrophomonas maltophilia group sp. Smal32 TaxID=3377164 RepID=UPI0018D32190|nr:BLUF domain-containing protein [Stenotrophomonas maltophilia]MBH1745251.1 BLUF domain-containing protein [Stenotrophomonas maltophilia]